MRPHINDETLDALAEMESSPYTANREPEQKTWMPDLNPTQMRIFNDPAKFILGHAEKASGKSIGFLHKLVRHAWENNNAFALIIAPSIRTGADGVVHDLETLVLPTWRDGNRQPANIEVNGELVPNPDAGELMDDGVGLEHSDFKMEPDTKDRVLWIRNRFGGGSKVKLISIPYAEAISGRIKGPAPSFIYVEELTDFDSSDYFTLPAAQLGRRRDISGPQQWCASCNPKGPSHWVYKKFFEEPVNKETGGRDPDYSVYHVPFEENRLRVPIEYRKSLEKIFRSDPTMFRRLISGEWIDVPTGEGLFREYFDTSHHVIGDLAAGTGITPQPGTPCIIGMDLGQVNSTAIFLQAVPTKNGLTWVVFDEVCYINKKILYRNMAKEITDRMKTWDDFAGTPFAWEVVADSSATTQWRPNDGNYDAAVFERTLNEYLLSIGRRSIRVKGCRKGDGSIEARTRIIQGLFAQDRLYISAQCEKTVEAYTLLESDEKKPMHGKRSPYLHVHDGCSYPIFEVEMGGVVVRPDDVPVRMVSVGG